jgi:hypothetical protein
MRTKLPDTADEKITSKTDSVQGMQRLRLRRFGMAVATYALVLLASALVTRLGLGGMGGAHWALFIGFGLFGNSLFLVLFLTNANLRFPDPSLTREQIVFSALWGMMALYFLPKARPIVLMLFLPAFSFGMLRLTRREYFEVVACVMGLYAALLGVEYFTGRRGFNIQYELFLFAVFGMLLSWHAFFGGFVSRLRRRLRAQKEQIQQAHEALKLEMQERNRAQTEKDKLIGELKDALRKVKTLSGLLPICASCKKIRDDSGYWNHIESYVKLHSEAEFSHGICPDCAKKLYPDFDIYQ